MELSEDTASEYFAALNPIARKISIDIDETKSNYEHIWSQLSPTEQRDILNETLIRPEIALRYFDNFSASSSSSSVTLSNGDEDAEEEEEEEEAPAPAEYRRRPLAPSDQHKQKKTCDKLNTKNVYSYDGKNIETFSAQKTGSRIVNDEVIGAFRDEHSAPFSYKTKSQINLKLFTDTNANCRATTEAHHQAIVQHQKYQKFPPTKGGGTFPVKGAHHSDSKGFDKIDGNCGGGGYERFYGDQISQNNLNLIIKPTGIVEQSNSVPDSDDMKGNFLSKFICKNSLIFNAGTNLIIKANQVASGQSIVDEEDEELNLIKNFSYSGLTSSSSVPSEEEEEEKQICEDSKLLLENDALRKGFDFLNNW